MDTDDLSTETYKAVLITSEKFNHDLTLQFGVLAGACSDDDEYLSKAKKVINEWRKNLEFAIEIIFFGKKPKADVFDRILTQIENNINETQKISIRKRKFDF